MNSSPRGHGSHGSHSGAGRRRGWRKALDSLQGKLLIGTINSIGVRRDVQAVDAIAGRLQTRTPRLLRLRPWPWDGSGIQRPLRRCEDSATAPAGVRSAVAEGCVLCASGCWPMANAAKRLNCTTKSVGRIICPSSGSSKRRAERSWPESRAVSNCCSTSFGRRTRCSFSLAWARPASWPGVRWPLPWRPNCQGPRRNEPLCCWASWPTATIRPCCPPYSTP